MGGGSKESNYQKHMRTLLKRQLEFTKAQNLIRQVAHYRRRNHSKTMERGVQISVAKRRNAERLKFIFVSVREALRIAAERKAARA